MIERKFLGHIKAHYSFPEYRKVVSYIAQIPHAMNIFKKLDKYFIIETDDEVLTSIEVVSSHKAFPIREVWNVLKNAGYLIDYDDENEKLLIYVYPAYYLKEHAPKTNKKLKGEKIKKETIRKMGKCFKFSPDATVRMKGKNMVRIEDLHIGQIVYLQGRHPAKIIGLDEHGVNVEFGEMYAATHEKVTPDEISLESFNFSDLEVVKTLHHELWSWLEINPDLKKDEWPRWKNNGGDVPHVLAQCFYCEYDSMQAGGRACDNCPGDWKNSAATTNTPCDVTSFGIHKIAHSTLEQTECTHEQISKLGAIKSKAAHIIKNS